MTAARPDQVGNSGPNGMDEPPFPPAGEPIPDEAEAVARDAVRPQDQLRGERHPPQQYILLSGMRAAYPKRPTEHEPRAQ